jgi:hypothetical protein
VIRSVWITEFGLKPIDPTSECSVYGTWGDGLWSALLALLLLDSPRVAVVDKQDLAGYVNSGQLFLVADAFDFSGSPDSKLTVTPFAQSAAGSALALVANASAGADGTEPLDLSAAFPALVARSFFGAASGTRTVIINPAAAAAAVPAAMLPHFAVGSTLSAAADATKPIDGKNYAVTYTTSSVGGAAVHLPAYSVTLVY